MIKSKWATTQHRTHLQLECTSPLQCLPTAHWHSHRLFIVKDVRAKPVGWASPCLRYLAALRVNTGTCDPTNDILVENLLTWPRTASSSILLSVAHELWWPTSAQVVHEGRRFHFILHICCGPPVWCLTREEPILRHYTIELAANNLEN